MRVAGVLILPASAIFLGLNQTYQHLKVIEVVGIRLICIVGALLASQAGGPPPTQIRLQSETEKMHLLGRCIVLRLLLRVIILGLLI